LAGNKGRHNYKMLNIPNLIRKYLRKNYSTGTVNSYALSD
jgi:hypothetical protein